MSHTPPQATSTDPPPPQIRPMPPELLSRLGAFKRENSLSDERLGRLLGCAGSQVNRALNDKFVGDIDSFVVRAEDLLKSDPARRRIREQYRWNGFTRNLRDNLDLIRRTGDIGLLYSPAGKGKTCGIALYLSENPLAAHLSLSKWSGDAAGITRALFRHVESRGWVRNAGSKGDFLTDRFRDSNRLIIVDNAHRLTRGARQWVFDFHDETACPIALVGNPEILDEIRKNDQQFSRVGFRKEIKGAGASDDADMMVEMFWPEARGKLGRLPAQVIRERGHLRALKKELLLARELLPKCESPIEAFRAAHTQLVRDYALGEDE